MGTQAQPNAKPQKAVRSSIPGLLGQWVRQGAEGVIATQKILLDLAAQQNALALTIIRERMGMFTPAPSKALVDLTAKSVDNLMEAQKLLLHLAARQNAIVAQGLAPVLSGTPVAGMADVFTRGMDNVIVAQKHFLDLAEQQIEGAIQDYRDGKKMDTGRLPKLVRDGMKNFIDSQKRFLEIVEEQITGKAKASPKEAPDGNLFELSQKAVDAFVDVQKQLLDLAASQIGANMDFVRDAFRTSQAGHPITSLEEVMRKSVDSFVAAQKALTELASKPRRAEEEEAEHEPDAMAVH